MIFDAVHVFDGTTFVDCAIVEVDGDTIASVSQVDGRPSRTLLPGFVDAHVHLGLFRARDVLRGGVTTVRDLGCPWSEALDGGPDVLRAGQMLTATGGYPSRAPWAPRGTAREVAGADDAREAVREQAERGARVVKVAQEPRQGPTFATDVLRAVCDEAHARDLKVTSHCGSLDELERALDAGVDEFAHGLWSGERIPDATIDRMVRAGAAIVPTLHIEPMEARIGNTARFAAAGGKVIYGTDMGNPPAAGAIDADEITLMRAAGMTLDDALAAATSRAASHIGLLDRGRVAAGARADVVLVEGDPREDVRALSRIEGVWKAGARA